MSDLLNMESSYLKFLPSIFRGAEEDTAIFFERFLKIFEKFLTGIDDSKYLPKEVDYKSFAETLDSVSLIFHPDTSPEEFLDWFSSWVGLVLKEDWSIQKKREIIARIIPIYRMRGTKRGIEEYLNIYVGKGVSVNDNFAPFQIGVNSQVGISTTLGFPHFFVVEVILSETERSLVDIERKKRVIESIIEREKPIHTDYKVIWKNVQSMQVEIHSTVEVDTLLWSYE